MKTVKGWLWMTTLCLIISSVNVAAAGQKIIYINGQIAKAAQIEQIENAFGVTLLPNSRFTLDVASGDFLQAEDNGYIGNIYEYRFGDQTNEQPSKQTSQIKLSGNIDDEALKITSNGF